VEAAGPKQDISAAGTGTLHESTSASEMEVAEQVGQQQMSGRGRHETVPLYCLWSELWAPSPPTYGVYDVTDFSDIHPGSDLIITDAAEAADATGWFEMAAHSDAALIILKTLAVPGLEALQYDPQLQALQQRNRQFLCGGGPLEGSIVLLGVLLLWCTLRNIVFEALPSGSTSIVCTIMALCVVLFNMNTFKSSRAIVRAIVRVLPK